MLEEVLSIAVTEAVCEWYFCICSTIVKKPSITNMNDMALFDSVTNTTLQVINNKDMFNNLSSLFNCYVHWYEIIGILLYRVKGEIKRSHLTIGNENCQ